MTSRSEAVPVAQFEWAEALPVIVAAGAFGMLFVGPIVATARTWVQSADAGHGMLLAPLAVYLAWRSGRSPAAKAHPLLGVVIVAAAVVLRYVSALAAELFTMRLSVVAAALGVVVFVGGVRQALHWWLPGVLLLLSLPLPEIVLSTLALPLQFRASEMGAALLAWRHVPVELSGNVIHLPGAHQLFVTEACSGLRSLSALLALGIVIGGLFLKTWWARGLVALSAIPIAMALNAIRIFVTGFAVHFIDPALGEGLMHYTEGWVMFVAALAVLSLGARLLFAVERLAIPVEASS